MKFSDNQSEIQSTTKNLFNPKKNIEKLYNVIYHCCPYTFDYIIYNYKKKSLKINFGKKTQCWIFIITQYYINGIRKHTTKLMIDKTKLKE